MIKKLIRHTDILYRVNLDMNLKEFFAKGTEVLRRVAQFYIEEMAPASTPLRLETAEGD